MSPGATVWRLVAGVSVLLATVLLVTAGEGVSTALTRRVLPPLASAAAVCTARAGSLATVAGRGLASLSALTRTTAGLLSAVAGLSAWARRSTAAPAPALAVSSGET